MERRMRRRFLLLLPTVLLLSLSSTAFADSLAIGTLTYLGENSQGISQYKIQIDTNGITAEPFTNRVAEVGSKLGAGDIAIPTTAGFTEIIGQGFTPNCPCTSFFFGLFLSDIPSHPVTFLLANGQPFTAYSKDVSTLLPLPGQTFLQPGQSVPIVLTAVPEPGTLFLMSGGAVALLLRRAHLRRG
jgi:hypothetical protein